MTQKPDLPDYPRSTAVLIGCARYRDDSYPQLPAAHNSLSRLRDLLATAELCGWPPDRITLIENPVGVVDLTKRILRICRETEDVLLLYYVGHGTITPSGELCLTLSDTEASFPDITGLEYRRVKQALLDSPARVKVAIIDCCYSGRAIEALSGVSATAADSTDTRGVYTMTASDHAAHVVPFARQAEVCTSFTGELIDLVRNGVPGAPETPTLGALYVELRRRLMSRSLPQPNQRGTDTADRFTFARNAQALHRFFRAPWGPTTVRGYLAHPSRISVFAGAPSVHSGHRRTAGQRRCAHRVHQLRRRAADENSGTPAHVAC
ncbi:caspase, EACC1-associated type [Actinophytocola sp.]|uniref:caspase, EACC1-associated type n=1 Tax=Actinophytocola sp. TaxID=1872138 RepID=UPI002ED0D8A4